MSQTRDLPLCLDDRLRWGLGRKLFDILPDRNISRFEAIGSCTMVEIMANASHDQHLPIAILCLIALSSVLALLEAVQLTI